MLYVYEYTIVISCQSRHYASRRCVYARNCPCVSLRHHLFRPDELAQIRHEDRSRLIADRPHEIKLCPLDPCLRHSIRTFGQFGVGRWLPGGKERSRDGRNDRIREDHLSGGGRQRTVSCEPPRHEACAYMDDRVVSPVRPAEGVLRQPGKLQSARVVHDLPCHMSNEVIPKAKWLTSRFRLTNAATLSVRTALTPHDNATLISAGSFTVQTHTSFPAARHSARNDCPSVPTRRPKVREKPSHTSQKYLRTTLGVIPM